MMKFENHSQLAGMHAFLSASKYHWVNYTEEHLVERYSTQLAAAKGTELHDLASRCITHSVRLEDNDSTISLYVNDAIDLGLSPEVTLVYSINAFGTADAIGFDGKILRIHDLKTGVTRVKMTQLLIYAAFFCLEYEMEPEDFDTELRIYQTDEVAVYNPEPGEIREIMAKIIIFDRVIEDLKAPK